MPQRVLRQFGIVQPYIPNLQLNRFHPVDFAKQDRRGKSTRNWAVYHHNYIQEWDNRHNTVWTDIEYTNEPVATDQYMNWFRRITVVYLTQPGKHAEEGFHETASSHSFAVETLQQIRHFLNGRDIRSQPDLVTISKMVEDGLQVCGEAEMMNCRPSQRSQLDIVMPVTQKAKRRAKKKIGCGESSSSRMDVNLADDSDEDFVCPPPPRSTVRGRHSVSHTGGTGEDIRPSDDYHSPPRSSVRDDFFGVDLENAVVQDTPLSRLPTSRIGKGIRGLFMRRRQED